MTYTELTKAVAERLAAESLDHVPPRQVKQVLETFRDIVIEEVAGGTAVSIPGFVKFSKKEVPARKAKKNQPNPFQPGETMDIKARPASTTLRVSALKKAKDAVAARSKRKRR